MSTNDAVIVGNAVAPPELRFTNSGKAVANWTVAHNYKRGDDERTTFIDCTAWESLAENCAESIDKGDRVIVAGRLEAETWETAEGQKRSKTVLVAESVGVELRFASATVTRNERRA